MRAHMTWLDEAEKRSFVEEALGVLERVGVELKGSAALPVLADLGADVDFSTGRRPPACRARAGHRRGLPAPGALRRRVARVRRGPGRRGAGALLLLRLRRVRARPRDRRPAALHADRPPGGDDPAGRGARGRRHVDHDHGGRRTRGGPRAGRLLRGAHRGAQARRPWSTAPRRPSRCCASWTSSPATRRPSARGRGSARCSPRRPRCASTARCSTSTRSPPGVERRWRCTRCPWPGPPRR